MGNRSDSQVKIVGRTTDEEMGEPDMGGIRVRSDFVSFPNLIH